MIIIVLNQGYNSINSPTHFSQMGMFVQSVDNITIPKSWLVAKAFEEINHEQIPKDSTTCSMEVL